MSAIFNNVPRSAAKLPTWCKKPHLMVGVLKLMLEAAYRAPSGAVAARIAADLTRLWALFAQGSARLVTQSAGRSGHVTYDAKIQRLTRDFLMFVIAHALEQQRQWPGVDSAVKHCLQLLDPTHRAEARSMELARWKEVVSVLQTGMVPLFASLDGADNLKQCLYASLRDPLNVMFKEINENYQNRQKYRGEA